jgi:hypothetical protein
MRFFLLNILKFIIPIIIFLFISDHIITQGLRVSGYGEYKEWNEIFNGNINADLVINGSSRPFTAISPSILDSVLHLKSFNLAMNGSEFCHTNTKYLIYNEFNKAPKIVIQALDMHSLRKTDALPFPEQFLPYFENDLIKKLVVSYGDFSTFDFYIPSFKYLYKYTVQFVGICEYFNLIHFNNRNYKGYRKTNLKTWDGEGETTKFIIKHPHGIVINLDTISVKLFDSFLQNSKKLNIKVILVYPPLFIEYQYLIINREEIMNLYKQFTKKYDLIFLDYSNDPISYNKSLFYNANHLNAEGSEIFSKKLSIDIKKKLN